MNTLVDTHALIWFITDDTSLSRKGRNVIKDTSNLCYISIASLWEMGIKASLGKLELKNDLGQIFQIIYKSGFDILEITPAHILMNTTLTFYHRDPFDRLMIAQAKYEGFKILSKDRQFNKYDIELIW